MARGSQVPAPGPGPPWPPAATNMGFYQRLGEWRTPSGPLALVTSHQKHLLSLSESTRAKIDFYSERLKQLAGTNFNKLATESTEDSSTGQSKVSSSSKEEEKENASCAETYEEENVAALKETEESGKPKSALEAGAPEQVCVPDSSNNEPEEEPASDDCPEEQHSSGSVDEELLEEDDTMDTGETKTTGEEIPEPSESEQKTEKLASPSNPNSLVGELMNKFGFNDILEYQEAYRKAVQESREATDVMADNNNTEETKKATNGLKLRSDITIDPERNFSDLSKSEILRNFETLKRLRPELGVGGLGHERETLFAGE